MDAGRLGSDARHRAPAVLNIRRHAPRVAHFASPRPDVVFSPLTDGEQYGFPRLEQSIAHRGIILGRLDALVGVRLLGQAVVKLPVVDAPCSQSVCVFLLVTIRSGITGAGESSRIAVQAELHAHAVHLLSEPVHALGKLGRVRDEVAR